MYNQVKLMQVKMTENIGIGSPLKSFIEKTRKEAEDGLGTWELKAPIELELSAIVRGKVGGGLDIEIINLGAKVEGEQIQKIKLAIGPKDEVDEAEKRARIEKAKTEEALEMRKRKPFTPTIA